jgi:hypothetical protein
MILVIYLFSGATTPEIATTLTIMFSCARLHTDAHLAVSYSAVPGTFHIFIKLFLKFERRALASVYAKVPLASVSTV